MTFVKTLNFNYTMIHLFFNIKENDVIITQEIQYVFASVCSLFLADTMFTRALFKWLGHGLAK